MKSETLKKLSLHYLCDSLGFEEGKCYYYMISQDNGSSIPSQSHSTRYRLLKKLYETGVISKIGLDGNNSRYFPLPPTFLVENINDNSVLKLLEELYIKNCYSFLLESIKRKEVIHLAFKGYKNNGLILFLLKYFMKKSAIILMGGTSEYQLYVNNLDEDKLSKIKYFCREDFDDADNFSDVKKIESSKIRNRRVALIDDEIFIEFLKIPNKDFYKFPERTLFLGYMVGSSFEIILPKGNYSYMSLMKKEIEEVITC